MNDEIDQISYILPNEEISCEDSDNKTQLTADFSSDGDHGTFSFTDAEGISRTASMTIVSDFTTVDSLVYNLDKSTTPSVVGLTLIGAATPPLYPDSYVLQVFIEKPDYKEGNISLQGIATNLMLFKVIDKNSIPPKIELISAGHNGTISLLETGDGTTDTPIIGTINAKMGLVKASNYITSEY